MVPPSRVEISGFCILYLCDKAKVYYLLNEFREDIINICIKKQMQSLKEI